MNRPPTMTEYVTSCTRPPQPDSRDAEDYQDVDGGLAVVALSLVVVLALVAYLTYAFVIAYFA